jgi:hypothetical protein
MRLYLIVYPTGAQDEVHLPVGLRQQRLRQLELQERDEEKHQQGRTEGNHSGRSLIGAFLVSYSKHLIIHE